MGIQNYRVFFEKYNKITSGGGICQCLLFLIPPVLLSVKYYYQSREFVFGFCAFAAISQIELQ